MRTAMNSSECVAPAEGLALEPGAIREWKGGAIPLALHGGGWRRAKEAKVSRAKGKSRAFRVMALLAGVLTQAGGTSPLALPPAKAAARPHTRGPRPGP